MVNSFLPRRLYIFFFFLLGIVYIIGLFVPLIDNDSAHHATIALRMHLTGNYAELVDQSGDYLDKPHLLFWLAAFSYKIFGVTAFAYKLPSFLFTILGVYSTYRIGKSLYNEETGRLSALLLASAFAFALALSDVRMDAILTAAVAFTTWQLISFVQNKRLSSIFFAAMGLALAFSTKGHIGVFVPAVTALCYILYRKDYRLLINWKWLMLLLLFAAFISPVLYAYYLQYNLHPEKIVRGKDHINGIKFILLNQSVERFTGGMGADAKNDYLFFIHTFLWAFAPWSLLAYLAVAQRLKNIGRKDEEWTTTATFIIILLVVSFSGFKLPHYLNIVFPVASVMTAVLILKKADNKSATRGFYLLQLGISVILLAIAGFVNTWAFPVRGFVIIGVVVILLAIFFFFLRSEQFSKLQKAVLVPVSATIVFFFLMNSNFYPQLLQYQAGHNLANITKEKVDPADVYIEKGANSYSASYTFKSKSLFQYLEDSLIGKKNVWLLTESKQLENLRSRGYKIDTIYKAPHFRITKLNLKFLNPETRRNELSSMMLIKVVGSQRPQGSPNEH